MFYLQAPAGNTVSLKKAGKPKDLSSLFSPYSFKLYGNGTSALAAALIAIVKKSSAHKREVILPAYACPDLVSAILYAGCIPILSDLEKNSARLCLAQLEDNINKRTAAIIAVNLFGITENGSALCQLAKKYDIHLIEDSAQFFPQGLHCHQFFGDYIITSFGRGKPASILTGGAVLTKTTIEQNVLPASHDSSQPTKFYYAKVVLYNLLTQPYIYAHLEKVPGINLGQTKYKALHSIAPFNRNLEQLLSNNIDRFSKRKSELVLKYQEIFHQYNFIDDLYKRQSNQKEGTPLRYPVLVENNTLRNDLYEKLKKNGVGVSKMYPSSLNQIDTVKEHTKGNKKYQNADDFSSRILTLPTHNRVQNKDLLRISKTLTQ